MIKKLLGALCLLAGIISAQALTLEEAVQMGLTHHYQLASAQWDNVAQKQALEAQIEVFKPYWQWSTQSGYTQSRLPGKDDLSVQAGPQLQWKSPIGTQLRLELQQSAGSNASTQTGLHIEQPLLKGAGRTVNENALHDAQVGLQEQALTQEDSRQHIVQGVIQAYYGWLRAQIHHDLQAQMLQATHRLFRSVDERINAGRLPAVDRAQPAAQLARQEHLFAQGAQHIDSSYWQLCAQMGVEPQITDENVDTAAMDLPTLGAEAYYLEAAEEQSVNLQRLNLELTRAERHYKVAQDAKRSDLSLLLDGVVRGDSSGDIGTSAQHYLDNKKGYWSAQLQWRWPLGQKATREQSSVSAHAALEKIRLQQKETRRQLTLTIKQLWSDSYSQYAQLPLRENAVALAKLSWENSQEKFQAGRASLFEVIALKEQWFSEEVAYLDAKISYIEQLYRLEEQAGILLQHWEKRDA